MKYTDGILAYKLLINATLLEERETMSRTSIGKMTLENTKKQLKVIHNCTGKIQVGKANSTSSLSVKIKPVFKADYEEYESFYKQSNQYGRKGHNSSGTYHSKPR